MLGSSHQEPEVVEPAAALMREVGAALREARGERGKEILDVAEILRIQPSYLAALERGDLSAIPGRTYALGFLRSYAQYLGFDGDDLIAQIRSSVGLAGGALHGRAPLAESRLPKLPILAVSLAVLAGAYAGWAYVEGGAPAELVEEVPDELRDEARNLFEEGVRAAPPAPARAAGADALPPPPATASGAAASPPAPIAAPAPAPEAPVASEVPAPDVFPLAQPQAELAPAADPNPGVAGPAVRAAAVAPEVEAADEAAPGGRTAPAPAVEADLAEAAPVGREVRVSALPAPVPAVEADPVEAAPVGRAVRVSVLPALAPVAEADPAEAAPVGRAVRVSALPALAPAVTAGRADRAAPDGLEPVQQAALAPDAEVPERAPRTYGSSSAETRVVLRARDNAWVHVSSTNNDYLWVQTLQPGDRFIVPARPDLVLWTGNAGGVEVLVDGALLPALGPEAVVVRDVSLQPRALLRRLLPLPADHAGVSDLASAAKPPMMPPSSR